MSQEPAPDRPRYDAAVIGGGPAGLSAASWLARYRRSVVVLDSEEYRNALAEATHGYLGLDPVPPSVLRQRARDDLARYPTVTFDRAKVGRATRLEQAGGFELGAGGRVVRSRRVVLATGVRDDFPEVEGFFEHYGASVFHCTSCDGYEAKDCDVVVFGWGAQVTSFACSLLTWASSVTIVTDGRHLDADRSDRRHLDGPGLSVVEDDAVELVGRRHRLEGVRLAGGGTIPCQVAFFSIAHHPNADLAVALGCRLTDEGCVAVDGDGRTSASGVFAAGDLTPGAQLVANAVAKGAAAGIACARSLLEES